MRLVLRLCRLLVHRCLLIFLSCCACVCGLIAARCESLILSLCLSEPPVCSSLICLLTSNNIGSNVAFLIYSSVCCEILCQHSQCCRMQSSSTICHHNRCFVPATKETKTKQTENKHGTITFSIVQYSRGSCRAYSSRRKLTITRTRQRTQNCQVVQKIAKCLQAGFVEPSVPHVSCWSLPLCM